MIFSLHRLFIIVSVCLTTTTTTDAFGRFAPLATYSAPPPVNILKGSSLPDLPVIHHNLPSLLNSDHASTTSSSLIQAATAWGPGPGADVADALRGILSTVATGGFVLAVLIVIFSVGFVVSMGKMIDADEDLKKSDLWLSYQEKLEEGETIQDRPDLLMELMNEYREQMENGTIIGNQLVEQLSLKSESTIASLAQKVAGDVDLSDFPELNESIVRNRLESEIKEKIAQITLSDNERSSTISSVSGSSDDSTSSFQ